MKRIVIIAGIVVVLIVVIGIVSTLTQNARNQLGRQMIQIAGTDGVVELWSDSALVARFLKVDNLVTILDPANGENRPYRFGHGVKDVNQNGTVDTGEKRVYFEIPTNATWIFYQNPE